jgi:pyruvate-formate lyase-activating enzyme
MNKIKKDSSIIFYGAGENAERNLSKWISEELVPVCFADADPNKHFTQLCGYNILPINTALEKYPDYVIYITLGREKLLNVTYFLIDYGIPRDRIKYIDDVELRKGCDLLGIYMQFRANYFYACCSDEHRVKLPRGNNVRADFETHRQYVTKLIDDFKNEKSNSCDNCPQLREDIWDISPQVSCIQIATGFEDVRCNFMCSYCAENEYLKNQKSNNKTTVYNTLSLLYDLCSVDVEIELAAGEITVSPYCGPVLELIRDKKRRMQIFTNASLYNENIKNLINEELVSLVVSLDSGTAETFAKIKGVDCFEKVINNLKAYKAKSNWLDLKYIVLDGVNDNEKDIDNFVEIAIGLEANVAISANSLTTDKRLSPTSLKMCLRLIDKLKLAEQKVVFPFRENFHPEDLEEIERRLLCNNATIKN